MHVRRSNATCNLTCAPGTFSLVHGRYAYGHGGWHLSQLTPMRALVACTRHRACRLAASHCQQFRVLAPHTLSTHSHLSAAPRPAWFQLSGERLQGLSREYDLCPCLLLLRVQAGVHRGGVQGLRSRHLQGPDREPGVHSVPRALALGRSVHGCDRLPLQRRLNGPQRSTPSLL